MAGARPENLPHPGMTGIALLLFLSFLLPGPSRGQGLFLGRMEDPPALARRLALAVKTARKAGPRRRAAMIPFLVEAARGLATEEVGRVLDGLSRAALEGSGVSGAPENLFRMRLFLHALPEVQEAGKGSVIHLTVRLLVPMDVPPGMEVIFRVRDPWTGKVLREKKFSGKAGREELLRYDVTLPFNLADLPPGRYLGEAEIRFQGNPPARPDILNRRTAFYLLERFKERSAFLGKAYPALEKRCRAPGESPPAWAGALPSLVAVLGELDRTVNPEKGNPPLVDVDQASGLVLAEGWTRLMEEGMDPLPEAVGDIPAGTRVKGGTVVPMRVYLPPGLPPRGKRRGLLFLPDELGGEADLAQVHGAGRLPELAAKYKVVVACLQTGFLKEGGDPIRAARKTLIGEFGLSPSGITLAGQGRGASQAYYACLAHPKLWAGLVLVSGPPVDPRNIAPLGGKRTLFLEGEKDPDRIYLRPVEQAARSGRVRYLVLPGVERFLALSFGLEEVLAHAAAR